MSNGSMRARQHNAKYPRLLAPALIGRSSRARRRPTSTAATLAALPATAPAAAAGAPLRCLHCFCLPYVFSSPSPRLSAVSGISVPSPVRRVGRDPPCLERAIFAPADAAAVAFLPAPAVVAEAPAAALAPLALSLVCGRRPHGSGPRRGAGPGRGPSLSLSAPGPPCPLGDGG